MSDSNSKETEEALKKLGHAPAVKVAGGVRITQHHKTPEPKPQIDAEADDTTGPSEDQKVVISGVTAKGDKDFPTEAVKAFHEKPLPAKEPPHANVEKRVQQPRRQ